MDGKCDCQKENKMLKKDNKNVLYLLMIFIFLGLILVFKKCN